MGNGRDHRHREFDGGREDFIAAARIALSCDWFLPDEAEEWVADEVRSCYNCRARRWTPGSFVCLRGLL